MEAKIFREFIAEVKAYVEDYHFLGVAHVHIYPADNDDAWLYMNITEAHDLGGVYRFRLDDTDDLANPVDIIKLIGSHITEVQQEAFLRFEDSLNKSLGSINTH